MLFSVTGARILFLGLRTWSFELINRFKELTLKKPITMAKRFKAQSVFSRSNSAADGSNPTSTVCVCEYEFILFVLSCVGRSFLFCNPILFAICTSTFSKLCKDMYTCIQWHVEE
jgi:hypothetical protein